MAPTFSKEAILQGSIDHLCLVCESYLRSEREVCLHVATTTHGHNLDSTDYVEKYKNDRIRKVKKWYFCEFCNVLTSTMTAVGLHVKDTRHKETKSSQITSRMNDVIVAGNITIHEEAWHGFIENTCTVCNEEYEDKEDHKSGPSHVINLIQSKVIIDDDSVYRKIDDSTFQCLTCNEVVAEISGHLNNKTHKLSIQGMNIAHSNSKIVNANKKSNFDKGESDGKVDELNSETLRAKEYISNDANGKTSCILCNCDVNPSEVKMHVDGFEHQKNMKNANIANHNSKNASDILESIQKFQQNSININLESCTAVCKRCSLNLEYNLSTIESHIEEHKNNVQRKATGSKPALFSRDEKNTTKNNETLFTSPVFKMPVRENKQNVQSKPTDTAKHNDIQKMAEGHGLTYNPVGNQVYCQWCNKHIPSSVGNISGHVKEELHKINAKFSSRSTNSKGNDIEKISEKKCNLKRLQMKLFIRDIIRVGNILVNADVVINDKHCINMLSFSYFTMPSPGQIRCQVCEVNISLQDIDEHLDHERHERAMQEVPIVLHSESEFVREVRSNLFQCGYCNIYDSWQGMENHLKSTDHKENKKFANWRLSQYKPKIEEHRMERHIRNVFMMHLMLNSEI